MWFCKILIFPFVLTLLMAIPAYGDESDMLRLYQQAETDISYHLSVTSSVLEEFESRHSGQPYLTDYMGSGTAKATGGKSVQEHLTTIQKAANDHKYNLSQIGKVDQWVSKMEGQAYFNVAAAQDSAWQARLLLTHYDIAKLKYDAKNICKKAEDSRFEGEDPGTIYKFYEDQSKFRPIVEKNADRKIEAAKIEYKKLEEKYKEIGQVWEKAELILPHVRGSGFIITREQACSANQRRPSSRC